MLGVGAEFFKQMPMRSSTCYYRTSLGQQWGKLKLIYQDLTIQYGKVNTHETWGWEDLVLEAGSTIDYMTLNSNKFRIPSSMILMMIFTLCIPLEKRKKCMCAYDYACVQLSWIKAQRRQLFLFLQEIVTVANQLQEYITGKWLIIPFPSWPGVLCYSQPIHLGSSQWVSTTGCFNHLQNWRDIK